MAKLSHKISTNENNNNDQNNSKLNFTLSTKVENAETNSENQQKNKNNEQELRPEILLDIPSGKAEFLKFLYDSIDFKDFGKINKTFIETMFNAETETGEEEATKKIISAILTDKISSLISEKAEEVNKKHDELFQKLIQTQEKIKKQEVQTKNLIIQLEETEEQVYKTEKKYADSIAISDIINEFTQTELQTKETREISNMLLDAYKNGGKNGQKFVLSFLKGFSWVENSIKKLGEDEKENVDLLNESTKQLMQQISEKNSAERRPILDKIANLCNSYLFTYDFISPEQTLQIDPTIHNAQGLGGTVIKEGLSFAVVRRETRKAVYYADIKTR
ncbi:MAG: hypothetical protein JXR68_08215 [Bacteroidales bacterium]|nr:hypothetical protein [Bacteroidales bacterium]